MDCSSEDPEPIGNPEWDSLRDVGAGVYLEWKKYDVLREIQGTPLANNPDHVKNAKDEKRWIDSDLFRLLVLHNYGGVYFDADVILLRDLAPLLSREWLYQWGSSCNYANGALANIHKKSELSYRFLRKLATTKPGLNSFDWGRNLYFQVRRNK